MWKIQRTLNWNENLLPKQKKQEKKFFNWERLYYGSSIRSCFLFSLFWVPLLFFKQPNVIFEMNELQDKYIDIKERMLSSVAAVGDDLSFSTF